MQPISYWRNRERYYRLLGSRCRRCGKEAFPPVHVCKKCGSTDLEEVEMPKTGKLLTYTVLREPAEGYREFTPIFLGFIELDNGVRIVAQLTDVREDEIKIGMHVRAVLRKLTQDGDDGLIYYGYKFVKV